MYIPFNKKLGMGTRFVDVFINNCSSNLFWSRIFFQVETKNGTVNTPLCHTINQEKNYKLRGI